MTLSHHFNPNRYLPWDSELYLSMSAAQERADGIIDIPRGEKFFLIDGVNKRFADVILGYPTNTAYKYILDYCY